ncbi:coiled-coil domain-containing protein 13-like [Belonocnema kinseyi]|uniref:coiled-coil domain-containing protein 13-like n=1 Tax=Belonocnema kinseyi TaxID=2817044 RepID=UPI00143CF9E1|nr:coiled-coil domain-containing protein 13-like [Belonocnema kinseyi]
MSVKKNEKVSPRNSFDFEDDVIYENFIQEEFPSDIVFPETLTLHLRNRIQEITSENGCLRKALQDAEEKLQLLENTVVSETSNLSQNANETSATKIILLSKMCKDQAMEVENLKSKCKILNDKLVSTKSLQMNNTKFKSSNESAVTIGPFQDQDENSLLNGHLLEKDVQIKALNEKLHQANTKILEVKNTNSFLKQEVNKAHKLLCSEVGENVTTTGLFKQSGWRGRAEQIQLLHKKVLELQGKLSEYDGSYRSSSVSLDSKAAANLRNLEKERRQQVENSARELRRTEIALENMKRKLEAAKARIKVLESEVCAAKRNVMLLNEKRSHDDQLIEALNGQLKAVDLRFQDREVEIHNQKEKIERELAALKNELEGAQVKNKQLQRKLEEREKEIEILKAGGTLKKQCPVLTESKTNLDTPRNMKDPNEYVVLGLAADAESERLLELVSVLNSRLDKERNDTDRFSQSLRTERNKVAKLETKIQKLEMERVNSGYRFRLCKTSQSTDEKLTTEQIRYKIELLEEENLALKTRLATVQREKTADLLIFKQMLDQTRKIFHDAFR